MWIRQTEPLKTDGKNKAETQNSSRKYRAKPQYTRPCTRLLGHFVFRFGRVPCRQPSQRRKPAAAALECHRSAKKNGTMANGAIRWGVVGG